MIRGDNQSNAKVLQMFQIYDCWVSGGDEKFCLFGIVDGGAGDWHSEMIRDDLLFPEA